MDRKNTYNVITASAGSGKTYTLVQRILMLCLAKPNKYDTIKNILALTFTNKAANEMKARILEWLKKFTSKDYTNNGDLLKIQEKLKEQNIIVDINELHYRSQKVLDYILHHYSTLNIGTIDKFNSRLVRSFSYELGLPHQFNLEIQNEPFLIEAVDKMLENIGTEGIVSEAFMDYINYNLDNDEKTNLSQTLYKKAKNFVNDIHYEELKNNSDFDWEAYEKTKNKLRDEIQKQKNIRVEIAEKSLKLISNSGLKEEDFQAKSNGIAAWFKKFLDFENRKIEKFPFNGNEDNYRKLTTSKDTNIINAIGGIIETLIENRASIIKNYISEEKKKIILSELLPLKFNKEIEEKLKEIEEENDLVLLSKFNILIGENLKNENSGFIYEKIGTQYLHYFFDEFQDTSKMQWENLSPLKENAIHSEEYSFTLVGDPKQSIYRFRGGDSELMMDIINHKENSPIKAEIEVLENNWRSSKNIVEFNNKLYEYISQSLNENHRLLFSEKGKQIPQKENLGRVKICLSDYTKSNSLFYENVADQMHRNIQDCINNGYQLKDISILCRGANEIKQYSQMLGNLKINYKNEDIYIKTISEKGLVLELSHTLKAVIYFLKWELQTDNKQHLVNMLYSLKELGRIHIEDFSEEMQKIIFEDNKAKSKENIIDYLQEHYHLNLKPKHLPQLNLYNNIEYFVQEFSVINKETDFLLNFLENLYNFTQNAGLSLKDFIKYWDEEASQIPIQASENIDAIRLMTIHASKGLEFPIVFLPLFNSNKDRKFTEWLSLDNFDELKSVNITAFTKDFENYDEDIRNFNEINTYKNKIDRFCVQYVATTRAVEQLFLYIQKASKNGNYLEILDFIEQEKGLNENEFDWYPEINNSFRKQEKNGNNEKDKTPEKIEIHQLSDEKNLSENIKIATPSKNYTNSLEPVKNGILTHEILAQIKTQKDIEKVLKSYLSEGTITQKESIEIKERIEQIISNPSFAKYFDGNAKIITEADIMISENEKSQVFRPDRLVETAEGICIIDFKTGSAKPEHQQQLNNYKNILEKIGKVVTETKIIYI